MAHQRFNSFSKCSSRFFSKELKCPSSCMPKCIRSTLSFEEVLCHFDGSLLVSWFTSRPKWNRLNPSFSIRPWDPLQPFSLFIAVILGYNSSKLSLRIVAISGSCKWPKFFIYPTVEISFSFPCSYQSNLSFPLVAEFHLSFEMFSISPQQAYSFRCWFSNNFVRPFS